METDRITDDWRCETCGLATLECIQRGGLRWSPGVVWHIPCSYRDGGRMEAPEDATDATPTGHRTHTDGAG